MSKSKGLRGKHTVRMPSVLTDRVKTLAEARGISMNDWIVETLAYAANLPMARRPGTVSPVMEAVEPPVLAQVLGMSGDLPVVLGEVYVTGRDGPTFLVRYVGGRKKRPAFWISANKLRFRPDQVPAPLAPDPLGLALVSLRFVGPSEVHEYPPEGPRVPFWSYRIFFGDGRLKIAGSSRGAERARALDGALRSAAHAGFTHYRVLAGNGDVLRLPEYGRTEADVWTEAVEAVSPGGS